MAVGLIDRSERRDGARSRSGSAVYRRDISVQGVLSHSDENVAKL